MYRAVRESVAGSRLFQAAAELGWIFAAILLAGKLLNPDWMPSPNTLLMASTSVAIVVVLNWAFRFYRRVQQVSSRQWLRYELLRFCVHFPLSYAGAKLLLGGSRFPEGLGYAVLGSLVVLTLARQIALWGIARAARPRRLLVLGTGPEALAIGRSLADGTRHDVELVGYLVVDHSDPIAVPRDRIVGEQGAFERVVDGLNVDEVIVAMRERRGALPLQALLEHRLSGVRIVDVATFFERVHQRVPLDAIKVSWLIFGDGFRQHALRRMTKRAFDVAVATALLIIASPAIVVVWLYMLLRFGTPVVERRERVGHRGGTFGQLAFRRDGGSEDSNGSAQPDRPGGGRDRGLPPTPADALLQLAHVVSGSMSITGPRAKSPPAIAELADSIPFYALRHGVRPGIVGWAQVRNPVGWSTDARTELEYDLYYVKNQDFLLDLRILFMAAFVRRPGR